VPNFISVLRHFLLKYVFKQHEEFGFFLGSMKQEGTPIAFINPEEIWKKEPLKKKIISILKLSWKPTEQLVETAAEEIFFTSIFGTGADYGEGLFRINEWHNSRLWHFDYISEFDAKRAKGIDAMSILIRTRHRFSTSQHLHLKLAENADAMCMLLHPMVVKLPVRSIQHYLDLHCAFAFNEIRKANFPNADDLISYIYELQFIQQKIALSLHEYLSLVNYNEKQKANALLIKAELSAITVADTVFTYLKASIEKIMVVIALTFGIKNLDSKKTHKAKIDLLENVIQQTVKEQFYYSFIFEFLKAENLDALNNYRTGILHKRGIADLQPHNYLGQEATNVPLKKIFLALIEHHSKNTAVLIGAYALLSDELVKIDPPTIKPWHLPM
jgi:hypothetical protein